VFTICDLRPTQLNFTQKFLCAKTLFHLTSLVSVKCEMDVGAFPKKGSFYFHKFCGPLGMHVILRPAGNACHFAARLLGMHVILRPAFSEKFILRPAFSECYFADRQN